MIYSRTGKYCIFNPQDYMQFREAGHLYEFKAFLENNRAICIDDDSPVYEEAKCISYNNSPEFIGFYESPSSERYYRSAYNWYYCYCKSPGIQAVRKLYSLIHTDTTTVEQSVKEDITCVKPNDDKGGCTMANVNESFKTVLSMKMLKGIMKDDNADLGKLFLMQQMTNGQPLQVSDVIKSKLINEFALDKDGDLPLEKVLLLQMLDSGSVDLSQLIMFKMMGSLLDEDSDKKKE